MALTIIDGDLFYYTFSVKDSDPQTFAVEVKAFVRASTVESVAGMQATRLPDSLEMLAEVESLLSKPSKKLRQGYSGINKPAAISDIFYDALSERHLYRQALVAQYPFDFAAGPDNSVIFSFPKAPSVDINLVNAKKSYNDLYAQFRDLAFTEGLLVNAYVGSELNYFWENDPGATTGTLYVTADIVDEDNRDLVEAERNLEDPEVLAEIGATGITEEQRKSNLTINEQAILLFRIGELMQENKTQRANHEGDTAYYDRFACLDYQDSLKAANVSNHVTSTTHLSPIFDNLKPIHFSAMIPKIRLFKSYLSDDKKTRRDKDRPQHLVEFEFEEFANADILKSSLSTNTGVGINSFDWSFDGENQFTAERFVKAALKLRAQSIDALDREVINSTTGESYSFTDLILPPPVYTEIKKKNNVIQSVPTDRRQFETRVTIEYGVLNKKSEIWGNDASLVKAVESLRLDMNLTLYTHELDLQSDGTVMVSLNFIGRVDASSSDPNYANILSTRTELEEFDGTTEQNKLLLDERRVMLDQAASFEQDAESLKELEKEREKLQGKTLNEEEEQRLASLNEQLSFSNAGTTAAALTSEIQRRNAIYGKDLSEEEYLERVSSEFDKVLLYQRLINGLIEKDNVKVIRIDPTNIANDEPITIGTTEQTIVDGSAGEVVKDVPRTIEQNASVTQELASILRTSVKPLYDNENYYIKYFYFGDLVDVVLDGMLGFSKDQRNDIRTLLGPIEIEKNKLSSTEFASRVAFQNNGKIALVDLNGVTDPAAEKAFNKKRQQDSKTLIKQKLGTAGKEDKIQIPTEKIVVNLADVPISLNLFLSWFADNVANQGVYSYSFQKFMVDSIKSLIVSSLRADSTKLILPKQKRKIVTTPFDSAAPLKKPDAFGFVYDTEAGLIVQPQQNGLFLVEEKLTGTNAQAASLPVFIPAIQLNDPGKYMADYLLVYAESVDYVRKYGGTSQEYRRDLNEGIYHLHAGRDAGVVKEIKLSAVNFEGYEEMMMLEAKKKGEPNRKRVYSANVTMNGIPIFRPGQKVYLNPAAYGKLETLKNYGLVGYYSIVRTSSTIESGQYQTTLECVFLGSG